ncbi:MAG: hypothetical protein LBT23_11955 [Synergistaceae bacterium]|jgi:hypothetical protein|nr:hypothetical protein [Synergistaceae bacterium]
MLVLQKDTFYSEDDGKNWQFRLKVKDHTFVCGELVPDLLVPGEAKEKDGMELRRVYSVFWLPFMTAVEALRDDINRYFKD